MCKCFNVNTYSYQKGFCVMARFLKNTKKEIQSSSENKSKILDDTNNLDISVLDYTKDEVFEVVQPSFEDLRQFKEKDSITWVNVKNLRDMDLIQNIASIFNLHPLTIENLLNPRTRPNMEDHEDYIQFSIKEVSLKEAPLVLHSNQLTVIFSQKYVLTFQNDESDSFSSIRNKIMLGKGRVRKMSSDFLAYLILERTIENYLTILSQLGELVEDMEDKIITTPSRETLMEIFSFKKEINYLRKIVRPVRDFLTRLNRSESALLSEESLPFYKDLLELSIQSVEVTDVYREMLSDQLSLYDSRINSKMNEIMKVLTVFSVIFIPLTFITGIYGTNFDYIPELKYKNGYFLMWGTLIFTASIMLLIFKRKKWI